MSLSQDQIRIIKSTAPVLAEHGNTITKLFYLNLIQENPSLKNVFNHTNQVNNHQPAALAAALYAYASNIDNLSAFTTAVDRICQKHVSLFITPEQYDIVGKYLLATMGTVLGEALTPEVLDAWTAAYWQLANLMISHEKKLYSEHDDWTSWREFTIAKKVKESSKITSFYLSPVDKRPLPLFKPGQYISVQTQVTKLGYIQSRQYSLSDQPNQEYYRISVKREDALEGFEPAYISNVLHDEKQVGDIIEVSPPHGDFYLEKVDGSSPVVLISAGVGLTPLISILNTLVSKESSRTVSWVHATRDTTSQAFADHVRGVCKNNSNFHAKVFVKNPVEADQQGVDYQVVGKMDLTKVDGESDLFLGDGTTEYYICGPTSFMSDIRKALLVSGVEKERIKLEVFGAGGLDE